MKKIFHFVAPREAYECDAAIVWCFDNRFELGFRKFLKKIGVVSSDPIKIAGGAKSLSSPDSPAERDFVMDQIRKSMRLHKTKRVILMVHSDCGAYGGLTAFQNDVRAEALHHRDELRHAAQNVWTVFPDVDIDAYYVDFEGVWDIELANIKAITAGVVSPIE